MPRRRLDGIRWFNVDSDLRTSPKFQRLCSILSPIDRRIVHSLLVSLFEFVAKHCAFTGNIAGIEDTTIANYCGWDSRNDGDPKIFLKALKASGFIWTKEYGEIYLDEQLKEDDVIGWFNYQPLVSDILKKRKEREASERRIDKPSKIRSDKSPKINPTKLKEKRERREGVEFLISKWQELAKKYPSLPKILNPQKLSADRQRKIAVRLGEPEFENIEAIFTEIEKCPFLFGDNGRSWRINFDWLIANSANARKILEGNYRTTESEKIVEAKPMPKHELIPYTDESGTLKTVKAEVATRPDGEVFVVWEGKEYKPDDLSEKLTRKPKS